ncbi:MAG TPA: CoA transferase [Sphingopyxis sp.]|uniref:CaiB/BaiF CoA transferase family protein n=1 Tax=Sphingopyxis sp. TaxID=1908224 RepID=UPI002CF2D113|nr:CoA transferase [Sphingopyxis sp.]HWW59065.1 CoA transferase [Sphingopyxis sp.]
MLDLLRGLRVLDLTTVVLGPYATQMLGDLGAEVLKVEPPAGDVFRAVRPGRSDDMGAGFLGCNRNKKSIALDLRDPAGREAFLRLVETVDVVVHNMRPKSAQKLGVDFEACRARNPAVVYCYASGFGQQGPYADEPAYDDTIQAVSGLAHLNADSEGAPRFLRTIIADKVGGLHLAVAVLAAVAARQRDGAARCIEAPMFESLVSFLMVEQLAGMSFDPPLGGTGYERLNSPYRKPFATRDGFISILPYTAAHWARFLELVGYGELAHDPRVTDSVERSRNIDMLYEIIEAQAPKRTTDEWMELLRTRDVPCARVNRLGDLFGNEHLKEVGMFNHIDHPTEGRTLSVRTPFRDIESAGSADRAAPSLGADTRSILGEAGFDDAEIARLIASGAAGAAA